MYSIAERKKQIPARKEMFSALEGSIGCCIYQFTLPSLDVDEYGVRQTGHPFVPMGDIAHGYTGFIGTGRISNTHFSLCYAYGRYSQRPFDMYRGICIERVDPFATPGLDEYGTFGILLPRLHEEEKNGQRY